MMRDQFTQFEDQIQRLIEGGFARLFAGHLHPRELAIQLIKSMEDLASRTPDGQLVAPDAYCIRLSPQDHTAILKAHPDILMGLTAELVDVARVAGIALISTPKVKLLADDTVKLHQVGVNAWYTTDSMDSTQSMQATKIEETTGTEPLRAFLILNGQQHIAIDRPVLNLGRRRDNHIIIDDPAVSRHHAQIRLRFRQYVLFDLGSSGGTAVNGCCIQETILQSGDVIAMGNSSLIYVEEEDDEKSDTRPAPASLPEE